MVAIMLVFAGLLMFGVQRFQSNYRESHRQVGLGEFTFVVTTCQMDGDNTVAVAGVFTNLTGERGSFRGEANVGFGGTRFGAGALKAKDVDPKERVLVTGKVGLEGLPTAGEPPECEATRWNHD